MSAAGDVYSLGLLLAYLVLGRPGAADRGGAAVGAEVTEASGVPALGSAVAACLALDPDGRPTAHAVEKRGFEAVRRAHPEPRLSRWAGEQVPLLAQQAAARARASAGAEPAAGAPVRPEDETVSGLDGAAFQRAFEATTADRDLAWDDPVLQQRLSAEEEDDPRTYDAVDPWEEDPSFGTDPLTEEAPRPAVRARPPAAEAPLTAESLAAALDDEPLDGPAYALRSDPAPEAEASPEQQAPQMRGVRSSPSWLRAVPMSRAPDLVDAIAYIAPGSDDEDVEEEATVEVDRQEAAVRFPGLYGSLDAGAAASAAPVASPGTARCLPPETRDRPGPEPPRLSWFPRAAPRTPLRARLAPARLRCRHLRPRRRSRRHPRRPCRAGRDRQEEEDSRKPLVLLLVDLATLAYWRWASRPCRPVRAPTRPRLGGPGGNRAVGAAATRRILQPAAAAAVAAVVPARDAADPPPGASGSPVDEPAPAPAAPAPHPRRLPAGPGRPRPQPRRLLPLRLRRSRLPSLRHGSRGPAAPAGPRRRPLRRRLRAAVRVCGSCARSRGDGHRGAAEAVAGGSPKRLRRTRPLRSLSNPSSAPWSSEPRRRVSRLGRPPRLQSSRGGRGGRSARRGRSTHPRCGRGALGFAGRARQRTPSRDPDRGRDPGPASFRLEPTRSEWRSARRSPGVSGNCAGLVDSTVTVACDANFLRCAVR